jgi:predicted HAD superfamily Cof-like phosphohydrolase
MTEKLSVNPFDDVDIFGTACDQAPSPENYKMYLDLIREETDELEEAILDNDKVEQLDALVDILVVTIGAIRAAGWDGAGAWEEVMRTNFAKIDPETGKVRKREDGKVLKPEGWEAPKLEKFLDKKN